MPPDGWEVCVEISGMSIIEFDSVGAPATRAGFTVIVLANVVIVFVPSPFPSSETAFMVQIPSALFAVIVEIVFVATAVFVGNPISKIISFAEIALNTKTMFEGRAFVVVAGTVFPVIAPPFIPFGAIQNQLVV